MEMLAEKTEMLEFLRQDPLGCKITVDFKRLQVKNFKYLGYAISCEKERILKRNQ
jgi:hypothetical protein